MLAVNFASLADCPACLVQGAVVETWDGIEGSAAASTRCRMCGRTLQASR